ncbi:hypothetical protein OG913_33525 [Microbispora hainanensis]|uniref:Uncharacterized protein n=1 Tax=Microbispora hainanensis TaxID=568844 RepID=A0ABZ1SP52_9ACTN|nr:hypothetical protein [Microbispora hainanensis]
MLHAAWQPFMMGRCAARSTITACAFMPVSSSPFAAPTRSMAAAR